MSQASVTKPNAFIGSGLPGKPFASQVVMAGELAFVSGVNAASPENPRAALPEWVELQTAQIFSNLQAIREAHALQGHQIVSVRIHMIHFERLFERMNKAYLECLGNAPLPARSCAGVAALERGALVEMDFVLRAGG